jgi:signal peptidase I
LDRSSDLRPIAKSGDRIIVHGWNYEFGGNLGPRRWDVVVFKNPNEPNVNYIKRLIGLPGETIEIIDGDVWVTLPGETEPGIARKPRQTQDALWIPVYEHDFIPRISSQNLATPSWIHAYDQEFAYLPGDWRDWKTYHPRWAAIGESAAWKNLPTRLLRFDGPDAVRQEIQFVTGADAAQPGMISDELGYNAYNAVGDRRSPVYLVNPHVVTDVRLSADVKIEGGNGYIELSISKYADRFFARLYADGRLSLERAGPEGPREAWGEARLERLPRPIRLGIGHADYHVSVEVDGRERLSSPVEYSTRMTARVARDRLMLHERGAPPFPAVRIAGEDVQAALSHVRIDRDVHYTDDVKGNGPPHPKHKVPMGNGVAGSPIKIGSDAYFVCGDNSTNSLDARCWQPPLPKELEGDLMRLESTGDPRARRLLQGRLGPQLRERYEKGEYQIGTVPADQMLGRAFLVYWPGFMPLPGRILGLNVLPDFGHVRWIH